VLESVALIGLMLDREGRILLCSDHLLALTGWMLGERPKSFIPIEDQGYLFITLQAPDGTTTAVWIRQGDLIGSMYRPPDR